MPAASYGSILNGGIIYRVEAGATFAPVAVLPARTDMTTLFTPPHLNPLIRALTEIRDECLAVERSFTAEVDQVAPDYRPSARNLLHYLGLRQNELRDLQRDLVSLGLSSLGRTEAHTLAGLDSVLEALHRLAGLEMTRPPGDIPPVDFTTGPALLADHAARLLGPPPKGRDVRIMVTMPSEAADRYEIVRGLLAAGMDVMRINCAHDDAPDWMRMIAHLRRAEQEEGRSCRVLMDLAGPRLRTGTIAGGRHVVRIKPRRNVGGGMAAPARVWLDSSGESPATPPEADAAIPIDAELVARARPGDFVAFIDCRGKERGFTITGTSDSQAIPGLWGEAEHGAYVLEGTALELQREGTTVAWGRVGNLPFVEEPIRICPGDTVILTSADEPARPALAQADGTTIPARIPCTLAEVFPDLKTGERIFFDDGRISGVIRSAGAKEVRVEIQQARRKGSQLRSDRGINLPDSRLRLPPLTSRDLANLDVAVKHADMVGLSFVRTPEDLVLLQDELARRGGAHLGVMLKIENRSAFELLPRLLLVGLKSPPIGVMVARGDLAVEVGFDRLAEVQEEILWLCEAAHVPVIWATQVLENLAQKGTPSRAEVTDAAMSGRAECVMLNKGQHVVEAARFLNNVLHRMQLHQQKKRSMLRKLSVSELKSTRSGAPAPDAAQVAATSPVKGNG